MSRISETWGTKDWQYSFDMKSTKTLNDIYSVDKTLEFNTAIDNTAFFIKATDNNILNGVYEIKPLEGDYEVWTNFEITNHNTDTFIGFGCVYSRGVNSNRLDTITCFDINSNVKQPWIKNSKSPVTASNWVNQHSFQTNQQCIMKTYDYTKIYCTASLLVTRTDYNPATGKYDKVIAESKTIKDCLSITDKTNRYIVGIVFGQPTHTDGNMSSPSMPCFIANTTISDMDIQLQSPLGNVVSSTDVGLVLDTQPNQYGGLVPFNPELIDFEHGYIGNSHYLPFKISVDDMDGMCRLLASLGYIIHCDVDNRHNIIYPLIENGMCDGSYTLDKDEFDESENGKWTNTDDIPSPHPVTPDKDDITEMKSNDVMSIYGLVKYYKMTSVELAGMLSEIEDLDDDKAMNSFVSCYHMPMLSEQSTVFSPNINIRIAGHTLSQTADHIVSNQRYTLATFNVPIRHGNAYDTMTKYYLYTPFTDVIPIDYKCYGRTITVELHPSVQDMTGSLTVKCDGLIVHKQSVSLGSALAISVENNAEKQQALIGACAKYAGSAMATLGGFMTGNIPAVAGGALGVIASTTNVMNALDRNYIHSYGTNTGASIGLLPSEVYFIENYVSLDKPANFASIQGNLVNKEMTLTNGMGFTKLDKPRISCSLTAPEINELMQMLENGVIL